MHNTNNEQRSKVQNELKKITILFMKLRNDI